MLYLLATLLAAAPAQAEISGKYIEARTCEVYAGPCFANADTGLTGKNAVMAWVIDQGTMNGVKLDGLGVVAVIKASDTLGLKQNGAASAILIVDKKADSVQRDALVRLAKRQAGELLDNVVDIQSAAVELDLCPCKENGCARLTAGAARIETRCINLLHDKTCGNEHPYYPPLAKNVSARAAFSVEHAFTGSGLNETWKDGERRGAYLGTFSVR
jgi:uncharacterized protein DUF1326